MIGLALLLLFQADPASLFEHANQLASQGRCEQAQPIYLELSKQYPDKPAIPFAIGQCQFEQKDYLAAAASFERCLKLDPTAVAAASMRGAALGMGGKTAEALDQLRAAAKQDPTAGSTFRMLGMFEIESGNVGPETVTALRKAVSLDSSDARAHYWLGEALLFNKEYDAAVNEFQAALQLQPHSPQAMLGHASALRASGQPETALAEFTAVLRQDPHSAKAQLGIARCQYDLQQFPQATQSAEAAEKNVADLVDRQAVVWLLARLYRLEEQPQKAKQMEAELEAMERDSNQKMARFRELQEEAARFRSAGEFAKVAATLEEALKIDQRQDSLVVLGDAYRQLGRPNDAIACYLRALQVGPEQAEIQQRLEQTRAGLAAN